MIVKSIHPKETIKLGKQIAQSCFPGAIVCLEGDLGAGKTTFVKGMAEGLRIKKEEVSSPTFVLMNSYEGKKDLYHFDLYRLETTDDMRLIGMEEFLYGQGISVVEWADRLGNLKPEEYLWVKLDHQGEEKRKIVLRAKGKMYQSLLKKMKEKGA